MKKKLLFFLLTAVCTLLCAPPTASAWNFTQQGDPVSVDIYIESGGIDGSTDTGLKGLTFNSGVWSREFTATGTELEFKVVAYYNGGSVWYGETTGKNTVSNTWIVNQLKNDGKHYQKGLTAGGSYRLELTGADDNANNYKWRIVENVVIPEVPYDFSTNTTKPKTLKVNDKNGAFTSFSLTYNATTKIWSKTFTPSKASEHSGYINFNIQTDANEYFYDKDLGKDAVSDTWVENAKKQVGGGNDFYQGGITDGKTYLFELRAHTGDNTNFDWRITEVVTVATPTFSPASGSQVDEGREVTISCSTAGATIYYTTDGSTPTTSSTVYSATAKPKVTTGATTIKAIAVKDGVTSAVGTATYTINPPFSTKVFAVVGQGFDYVTQNEAANWGTKYYNMTWNETAQRFETLIRAKANEIQFLFLPGYIRPSNQAAMSEGTINWSANFNTKGNDANLTYSVTNGAEYWVYIRKGTTDGNYQYAIQKKAGEETEYKVTVDLSLMGGARMWIPANVRAIINGDTSNPITGTVSGNTVTFTVTTAYAPSTVKFRSGTSTTAANNSRTFDFVNNKTYTLVYLTSVVDNARWDDGDKQELIEQANLPYGPEDFLNGPKFFLVGARMGNWHLQPEWELVRQANGTYRTRGGRYIFRTNFAVAKVNSYTEYIHQIYDFYTNTGSYPVSSKVIENESCLTVKNLDLLDNIDSFDLHESRVLTNAHEENDDWEVAAMIFAYDNVGEVDGVDNWGLSKVDKGTWVDAVTLTPTANGKYNLTFTVTDPKNIDNRLFSLVGSDIRNQRYDDKNSEYQAPMNMHKQSESRIQGWQDAWIQYDEYGKPYYDANKEYLYHTAFVPSIFEDNTVYFSIDVNGQKFDYTSDNINFVEANQLTDLANDPYREFYKALEGKKALTKNMVIQGGDKTKNTDYAFKVSDKLAKEYSATEADWKVFVIRDAWVNNEFKLWNGWAGTTVNRMGLSSTTEDIKGDGAVWNDLNSGPAGSTAQPVTITEITAGTAEGDEAQNFNKLAINQGEGSNYIVDELTYFNRIILLYNTAQTDALANSYVIFIQDDTQPVIKGSVNEDNVPSYEWNLTNVKPGSVSYISGYTVTRYLVNEEGYVNPKVVKTETGLNKTADGSEPNWAVSALTSVSDKTKLTESAALQPGTYVYNIKVTYVSVTPGEDGAEATEEIDVREANSNQFVVYSDAVVPQVRVDQLVSLTASGYKAIVTEGKFPGLQERFKDVFGPTVPAYKPDAFYLTYNENNLHADHYAIYTSYSIGEGDAANQNITKMAEVPAAEVIEFFKEPTYYLWAARFYVRALNYTNFKRFYSRQGVKTSIPSDFVTLVDVAAAEIDANNDYDWTTGSSHKMSTRSYTIEMLDGTSTEFVGSIVDRNGFLGAGDMVANLKYSFGGAEGKEKSANTTDQVFFQPVVPMPYDLSARYEYRTVEFGNPIAEKLKADGETLDPEFKGYLKIKTHSPMKHAKDAQSGVATQDADVPYEVFADESAISNERHLDCVIEFTRPNVSQAIFDHYNVYYTIHANPVVEEDATAVDLQNYKFAEIKGTYYDDSEIETDSNGNRLYDDNGDPVRNPYQFRIANTHPSSKIYPEFQIVSVVYKRTDDFGGDEYIIEGTYEYDPMYVVRKNNASATIKPDQFGLGYNPGFGENAAPKWYLFGHTDLQYTNTSPSLDVEPDDFAETQLFMLELTNKKGVTVPGTYLWNHEHNSTKEVTIEGKKWRQELNPFFINSLAVEEGEIPQLTLTPIYLFVRTMEGETVDNASSSVELRDLKLFVPNESKNAKRKNVKRRAGENEGEGEGETTTPATPAPKPTFQLKNDLSVTKNAAGQVTGATYDATNHDELVVSPGTYAALDNNDAPIMTGIEDVMTDGAAANGEAVYYNLQGIQVANPVKGQIYIRKAGNVSEKVVF